MLKEDVAAMDYLDPYHGRENMAIELLDTYQDMCEKQDEIIYRLGKIVAKQATELAHLRNMMKVEMPPDLKEDNAIVNEVMEEYHEEYGDTIHPEP